MRQDQYVGATRPSARPQPVSDTPVSIHECQTGSATPVGTGYRLGYARVSTLEQDEALQHDALTGAGCQRIFVDKVSGTLEHRPAGALPAVVQGGAETALGGVGAAVRNRLASGAGRRDPPGGRGGRRQHRLQLPTAVRRAATALPAVLPTLVRPVPAVAVVADTSGSMHEGLLARVLAEVEGLLTRAGLRAGGLPVLAVDTAVHANRRVSRARDVRLVGGGRTDMGAGIEAAVALRPRPDVLIVLTDGFTPWPADPPRGCRVVVGLLSQGGTAPPAPWWARTVLIDEPSPGYRPA